MTWYPAYLDGKSELVDMVSDQRPDFTVDNVKDIDLKMADTFIFSYLYNHGKIRGDYNGVSGTVALPQDKLNLLWGASLFYLCESLSYRGIIHYTPGGIQETRIGNVHTQFMRQQPMFFLGRGNPLNLRPLQPFRSFRQAAEELLETYIKIYNDDSGTSWTDQSYQAWDRTSRGFGAIGDLDVIDNYDAELTGAQ